MRYSNFGQLTAPTKTVQQYVDSWRQNGCRDSSGVRCQLFAGRETIMLSGGAWQLPCVTFGYEDGSQQTLDALPNVSDVKKIPEVMHTIKYQASRLGEYSDDLEAEQVEANARTLYVLLGMKRGL